MNSNVAEAKYFSPEMLAMCEALPMTLAAIEFEVKAFNNLPATLANSITNKN